VGGRLLGLCLSEQRADEQFDVTAGAKLIVDVDSEQSTWRAALRTRRGERLSKDRQFERRHGKEYLASTPLTIVKEGNTVAVRARHEHRGSNWSLERQLQYAGALHDPRSRGN